VIREDSSFVISSSALEFWQHRQMKYDRLAPRALDILVAAASHTFVERNFSVGLCGLNDKLPGDVTRWKVNGFL